MTDTSEIEKARTEMLAVLDAKLANLPEWRAFRAIDRALLAMATPAPVAVKTGNGTANRRKGNVPESYGDIALRAIRSAGIPKRTDELLEYVKPFRPTFTDFKRLKINIQSAMSRDKRIKSIVWQGGTAWWLADKPVPTENVGNLLEVPS